MTPYMKHSLLGTRRVILSIITRNFFVIQNKHPKTIGTNRMCFPRKLPTTTRNLLSWLSSTGVIRVVLSVSFLSVSYFVVNFLRLIFSVCHSFRTMCQSGRMKGFERCFKVEDQCNILRPPAMRIQIFIKTFMSAISSHLAKERSPRLLNELHLGKEKPVMGNFEPLLGITKPAEGLNKPCQGNVIGRKSFAAEGFNVKMPFISQTYTTAVVISFRQSHARTRNHVKYHARVVFTESFRAMVGTDEDLCSPCER